ncbi:MAG: hypothetical protein V1822_01405, partial [Candidatus Micrarchaeota archaeon]
MCIKMCVPFFTLSQIAPILANRNSFNKLSRDANEHLWSKWLLTRTFLEKSDSPLCKGDKIVYSHSGYSITGIVGEDYSGSPNGCLVRVCNLTPDNFNLEFNGFNDATVTLAELSTQTIKLIPTGTSGWANKSSLYLPASKEILAGEDALEQFNYLPRGDVAGLVACYAGIDYSGLYISVLEPARLFWGIFVLSGTNVGKGASEAGAKAAV